MPSILRWSREKRKIFLEHLRSTSNVSASAEAAGVQVSNAYAKREHDKTFRLEWQAAIEGALDDLEEEVRRRALLGTEKPVYYAGKKCGSITSFNDNLVMFYLKAKRPQVFSDSTQGSTTETGLSCKPREKLLKRLAEMRTRVKAGSGQ